MLIITTQPAEPVWSPVLGAEVLFAPIDRTMLRRARRVALEATGREEADGLRGADQDAAEQLAELGDALSEALILAGVRDWRGVYGLGEDGAAEPLAFSAETLAAAIADPLTFEAFDRAYVQPFAMREREAAASGNVFAGSPSTIGGSVTPAQITAASPAETTGDAARVPTSPKSRRRTKRTGSGAS